VILSFRTIAFFVHMYLVQCKHMNYYIRTQWSSHYSKLQTHSCTAKFKNSMWVTHSPYKPHVDHTAQIRYCEGNFKRHLQLSEVLLLTLNGDGLTKKKEKLTKAGSVPVSTWYKSQTIVFCYHSAKYTKCQLPVSTELSLLWSLYFLKPILWFYQCLNWGQLLPN